MILAVFGVAAYIVLALWCAVFAVQSIHSRRWPFLALWLALMAVDALGIILIVFG